MANKTFERGKNLDEYEKYHLLDLMKSKDVGSLERKKYDSKTLKTKSEMWRNTKISTQMIM